MDNQYLKCETNYFYFLRKEKEQLRASDYTSLRETIADSGRFEDKLDLVRAGKMIILSPTFASSDRYMRRKLQDILGLSVRVGSPDILNSIPIFQRNNESLQNARWENPV